VMILTVVKGVEAFFGRSTWHIIMRMDHPYDVYAKKMHVQR
jgi:hypothetical protein